MKIIDRIKAFFNKPIFEEESDFQDMSIWQDSFREYVDPDKCWKAVMPHLGRISAALREAGYSVLCGMEPKLDKYLLKVDVRVLLELKHIAKEKIEKGLPLPTYLERKAAEKKERLGS